MNLPPVTIAIDDKRQRMLRHIAPECIELVVHFKKGVYRCITHETAVERPLPEHFIKSAHALQLDGAPDVVWALFSKTALQPQPTSCIPRIPEASSPEAELFRITTQHLSALEEKEQNHHRQLTALQNKLRDVTTTLETLRKQAMPNHREVAGIRQFAEEIQNAIQKTRSAMHRTLAHRIALEERGIHHDAALRDSLPDDIRKTAERIALEDVCFVEALSQAVSISA